MINIPTKRRVELAKLIDKEHTNLAELLTQVERDRTENLSDSDTRELEDLTKVLQEKIEAKLTEYKQAVKESEKSWGRSRLSSL